MASIDRAEKAIKAEKLRSLAQNKYRFGVVIKAFRTRINDEIRTINEVTGSKHPMLSVDNVDFFVKDRVWKLVKRIPTPYGEIVEILPLKDKTPAVFEARMEEARAWAMQEWGLEILLPNEPNWDDDYISNLSRF